MSEVEIILLAVVFLFILMEINKKENESVLATYRAALSTSENWLL